MCAGIAALASEMGSTDKLLPKGTQNMFASLARSIAGQQLATQAAFKIHSRFVEVCKVSVQLLFYFSSSQPFTAMRGFAWGCHHPGRVYLYQSLLNRLSPPAVHKKATELVIHDRSA